MALQFQQEWRRIQNVCSLPKPRLLFQLTFASTALMSATLILRLAPLPALGAANSAIRFQESLWISTGVIRQSVIDLYRIQRSQQTATFTDPDPETAPPTVATESNQTGPAQTERSLTGNKLSSPAPQASQPAPAVPKPIDANVIDNALEMRVAIARNVDTLAVGTSTAGWLINTDGSQHCEIAPQSSLRAFPTPQGIALEGCQLGTAVWLEADAGGYTFVRDSWYRGRVLLINNGGQLLAVNFVLLGDYLASVVGSEMYHHWPLEAFKAQAVAARSYALTHHVRPASDYFDLDNTQRFQAYKGIAMETAGTQQAVLETAGEFISYQGGIVESLYAASDQIVQEAHGGKGMSQHGAKDFALQGFRYDQILGAYYPGTGLARLVVE